MFILALVLLPFATYAQTLEECQQAAEQNYPLIRQYDLIKKTTDLTVSNIAKGWLPQVSASGPDAGLNLTNMAFMQQHHTETALPYSTADAQRQSVVQQLLMEVELLALLLALYLQLTQQTLLVYADTHRRELKRTS